MSSQSRETAFLENERIVYPLQGVGHIQSIEERPFRDRKILYYIIYLEVSDMTVMIPVEKAEEIGIRAIVSQEDAKAALEIVGEENEAAPTDWKMRYQMNQELLKKGDVSDTALVVRTLYHRSKLKELPIMERKLYDSAKKLLVDEISLSLGLSKPEVEKIIHTKLEAESNRPIKEDDFIDDTDEFEDETFDEEVDEEEEVVEERSLEDIVEEEEELDDTNESE